MSLDEATRQVRDLTKTLAATAPADVAQDSALHAALQELMEVCETIEHGVGVERHLDPTVVVATP